MVVIPPFPPEGTTEHVSDYLVRLATGIPRAAPPLVRLFREELLAAREFILGKMERGLVQAQDGFPTLIAIHPGSGGGSKIWSPGSMARVAQRLIHEGRATGVLIIQGLADDKYAEALKEELDGLRVISVLNQPVLKLAAILRSARLFLGSDSGVAHLAAAVGVPTGVIFGPTDPRRWAPRGPDVAVIRKETHCAPCRVETMRTCPQRHCLEQVSVEDVLKTARSLLDLNHASITAITK